MNQLIVPSGFDRFRSFVYQILRWPYLITGVACYLMILCSVAFYLASAPKYTSQMELVLPGTGASSNVSLSEVGQVISQTTTPFSGGGFNPRVNYKQMLVSRSVLSNASDKLNIAIEDFGLPKVKLTEQTSIITINVQSTTTGKAAKKAWALYDALQLELDDLRADEVLRRDKSIKTVLQAYRQRTNLARNNIVDFQQRSLLVSEEQLKLMISQQSDLRTKKHLVASELSNLEQYVRELSEQLKVSPSMAAIALQLQSDPSYAAYLTELNSATTSLTEYRAIWGQKHPKVIAQKRRSQEAKNELLSYLKSFVGVKAVELISSLTVKDSPRRAELFSQLIEAIAKVRGKTAELNTIERTSLRLSDELKVASREVAELDRLNKEFDLAEAVFTSAAARLEANKADVFASYPVVQMLSEPSTSPNQTSPKVLIAVVACIFGFVFITCGLVILWQRKNIINLILKKS